MGKIRKIDTWIEKKFSDSPNLRAILQLEPTGIGSAYEVMLSHKISEMRNERFRTLMDELANGDEELTPGIIDSNEFLHAFFCVTKASLNTSREEKIKLFGKLLLHATKTNALHKDLFEEFVSILDDMSLREFQLLLILHNFEISTEREKDQNELQFSNTFWDDFQETVNDQLGINVLELRSILTRLNRTGLFESFSGNFIGYQGGKGKTTFLFSKFVEWVELKEV